jgi:hypothetical protein
MASYFGPFRLQQFKMTEEHKKSRLAHVPAVLGGSAALVAALTTLYVNLRDDSRPDSAPTATAQVRPTPGAALPDVSSLPAASNKPQPMLLRLDRIQVDNDGSAGSTDWTFQVSVGGEPLFSVPMPELNDKPGKNLVRLTEAQDASVEVKLPPGKNVALAVNGWKKKGWLPGDAAEVSGEGWLSSGFEKAVITLKNEKPDGPKFVLYFSITSTASPR